jgi:uncharacterized membrane protein YedE/YeeE
MADPAGDRPSSWLPAGTRGDRAGAAAAALAILAVGWWLVPAGGIPLFGAALALGALFAASGAGFTGAFRAVATGREGGGLAALSLAPAVAALVVVPVGTLGEGYSRFVAPVGLPLVAGAAMFGVGMQLANGCGSGCLIGAGQGSRRLWLALPFFCLGGVLGSLVLPALLRLPGLGELDLALWFGPWGGLAVTEGLLLLGALAASRRRRPAARDLAVAAAIGVLAAGIFLLSGQPWGITTGLTLFGAKAVRFVGVDLTRFEYWASPDSRALLAGPLLALPQALSDAGLLLGALLAAAAAGRLRFGTGLDGRGAIGGVAGGVLRGGGARLGFGCNIGAFVSGAASGSLHGFVWAAAALAGSRLGARWRPWAGLG